MRYIARHTRSRVGTSNTLIREYKSDRNALRHMHQHLASPIFEAGQYEVSRWPAGTFTDGPVVGMLYKLA